MMRSLDVGCGSHPRCAVNVDLLLPDSDKTLQGVPNCSNFVKADVRFLPFRSRIFFKVFCSHLLEHLDDPQEGLHELKRVSSKYVAVVLPFALFSVFDVLWTGRKYPDHLRWLRKHHKHFFLMDPLKTGSFKLMFPSLAAAIKKEKKFQGLIRMPIPFQTYTLIEVD